MAAKSFEEEVVRELAGKAVIWGPAVAGGFAFGPLGALVGAIASVVVVTSGNSAPGGDQSEGEQDRR